MEWQPLETTPREGQFQALLPEPMAEGNGPVTLGSWYDGRYGGPECWIGIEIDSTGSARPDRIWPIGWRPEHGEPGPWRCHDERFSKR